MAISFGVAASEPGGGFDLKSQFDRADAALYEAKQAGRDRVVARAAVSLQAVAA
ncbi:MAG: diguanylate cyclase [Actinomycetota bacterium]